MKNKKSKKIFENPGKSKFYFKKILETPRKNLHLPVNPPLWTICTILRYYAFGDPTHRPCLEVTQRGGLGIPVYVDQSDDAQVKGLFDRVAQENNGQLDVLVNNAFSAVDVSIHPVFASFLGHSQQPRHKILGVRTFTLGWHQHGRATWLLRCFGLCCSPLCQEQQRRSYRQC